LKRNGPTPSSVPAALRPVAASGWIATPPEPALSYVEGAARDDETGGIPGDVKFGVMQRPFCQGNRGRSWN